MAADMVGLVGGFSPVQEANKRIQVVAEQVGCAHKVIPHCLSFKG